MKKLIYGIVLGACIAVTALSVYSFIQIGKEQTQDHAVLTQDHAVLTQVVQFLNQVIAASQKVAATK